MTTRQLIAKLEREIYETDSDHSELELAYRRGHNDRTRALIAELSQGDVEAGLRELRDARSVTQLPRHWLAAAAVEG